MNLRRPVCRKSQRIPSLRKYRSSCFCRPHRTFKKINTWASVVEAIPVCPVPAGCFPSPGRSRPQKKGGVPQQYHRTGGNTQPSEGTILISDFRFSPACQAGEESLDLHRFHPNLTGFTGVDAAAALLPRLAALSPRHICRTRRGRRNSKDSRGGHERRSFTAGRRFSQTQI